MIAQWNSSLSVLPVARVMIAQWNSSLSVLPVARAMIAQWNSSLSVLPVAWVQFPATAEYFKGIFPGWWHGRKWLNLPSMTPHNLWTARRKVNVQPWTDDAERKEILAFKFWAWARFREPTEKRRMLRISRWSFYTSVAEPSTVFPISYKRSIA